MLPSASVRNIEPRNLGPSLRHTEPPIPRASWLCSHTREPSPSRPFSQASNAVHAVNYALPIEQAVQLRVMMYPVAAIGQEVLENMYQATRQ